MLLMKRCSVLPVKLTKLYPNIQEEADTCTMIRVKSGKFGRSVKFGQRPFSFHILMIGIKNKLTKQTVKILMRRSHLDFHCL